MEDTLNHLKFLNMLSPRGIHIPNCDKKGFYKKKQVSTVCTAPFSPTIRLRGGETSPPPKCSGCRRCLRSLPHPRPLRGFP